MEETKTETVLHIGIIGGGIVGLSLAHQILGTYPKARVTVLEKEASVAQHQTGHNSGVIHAGLYYTPGSLKAQLCRAGADQLIAFAKAHQVPYSMCGKLVVATTETEVQRLEQIYVTAKANQVPDVQYLDSPDAIAEVEPHVKGLAAIHSPYTGIINYEKVCEAFVDEIGKRGGKVLLNTLVTGIVEEATEVVVDSSQGRDRFDTVIVAAGLQSDQFGVHSRRRRYPKILPFAGTYYRLTEEKSNQVNGLIYPVPDPDFPFLGVHLTKDLDGGVTVGPDASLSLKRESYSRFGFSLADAGRTFFSKALWSFAFKNMAFIVRQLLSSGKRSFAEGASRFVSGIERSDLSWSSKGVRAQAVASDGSLYDDFVIETTARTIYLKNAPSPAATASLAIADYIIGHYLDNFTADTKK